MSRAAAPATPTLAALCERIATVDHDHLRESLRHARGLIAREPASDDLAATFARLRETVEDQLADEAAHVLPACARLDEDGDCDEALVAAVLGLEDDHVETLALLDRLEELAEAEPAAALETLVRDVREHVRLEREQLFPRVLAICG